MLNYDIGLWIFQRHRFLQWARHFEGINLIEGYAIAVDNSGNVYTSGVFLATGD
ncbi:MAG: SBBP repeat-containing protein [Bacteroidetes bacterium]|nr:SBBP repeat-containing protein [Bacteroidota bacterium]